MKYYKIPLLAFIAIFIAITVLLGCSSVPKQDEGSKSIFTTSYKHENKKIEGFDVSNYTDAPLQVVTMVRVEMSPEEAFKLVAIDIPKWFAEIPSLDWNHDNSENKNTFGKGSERRCELDGDLLVENIYHWQEGKMYAYAVDMEKSKVGFPVEDQLGVFLVESDGNGGSLITWRQYYNKKFHIMAPIVTWMIRNKMMEKGFESIVAQYGGDMVAPIY